MSRLVRLRRRLRAHPRWAIGLGLLSILALGFVAWKVLVSDELPVVARLRGNSAWLLPLAFSPDGTTLATGHEADSIRLWNVATGTVRSRLDFPGSAWAAAFSPDGRLLAAQRFELAVSGNIISILDVASGRELATLDVRNSVVLNMYFSGDGTTFGLVTWAPGVGRKLPWEFRSWDTATWVERPASRPAILQQGLADVSPDGRVLAGGDMSRDDVTLWDVETGTALGTLGESPTPSGNLLGLEFSPDGKTLAVGRADGTLELWDVAARRLLRAYRGHSRDYGPRRIAFAPGDVIAQGLPWGPPMSRGTLGFARALAAILTHGGEEPPEVVVWDRATGRRRARLESVGGPVVSPDGTILATATEDGVVLWKLRDAPLNGR